MSKSTMCDNWLCQPLSRLSRWTHFWGTLVIFNFLILLITGFFLGTTFSPSTRTAWESVFYINYVVPMGWFVRGFHHYASQSQVVLLVIFVVQILINQRYIASRMFTWWTTLAMGLILLGFSHTGYLLPWDQRAYQATEVFTSIAGASPVVGNEVKTVIQGGANKGHQTITRLYALHVMIFPAVLFALFAVHWSLMSSIFRKENTEIVEIDAVKEGKSSGPAYWPHQFVYNMLSCLCLSLILAGLTYYTHGAELTGPADSANKFAAARPEWYFLFLFRLLKTDLVQHYGLAFGAIHLPTAVLGLIILMPLFAKIKFGHYFNIGVMSCVLLAVVGLTTVALLEDAYDPHHQQELAAAKKEAERVVELALKPQGIPVEGALSLLHNDPQTQGPKIYAAKCSSCHHYNGHDGLGNEITTPAKAADLGNFGTREWVTNILTDFPTVMAPLKDTVIDGKPVGKNILTGEMANFSLDHKKLMLKPENKKALDELVEFLYAQSLNSLENISEEQKKKVAKGQEIYEYGELSEADAFDYACIDCHTINPIGPAPILKTSGEGPVLTGYGGKKWLTSFILNPGAVEHYGYTEGQNAMPAFEGQLSEKELQLLVDWLTTQKQSGP